jgi:hypothetical protein
LKLNGESGFPHSEIVGSKLAHSSPTLIAACHVLHRLCMPRHPPNALTSRLRVRTTNDKAEPTRPASGSAGLRTIVPVRQNISASIDCVRRAARVRPGRARPSCTDAVTASISRTHSQCQRRGRTPLTGRSRIGCLHLWRRSAPPSRGGGAYRDRTDDLKLAKLALSQLS